MPYPKTGSLSAVFGLLLVVGAFSQIAQALLIRELLVIFSGNEISIGAFYGSWLFWIALGGWLALLLERRKLLADPFVWLGHVVLFLPVALFLQIVAARLLRQFMTVGAGQFIPLDHLLLTAFVVTLPVGVAIGLLFPLACKGLDPKNSEPVTTLYVLEALGALSGALLFTFLFIEQLGTWRTFGLLTAVVGAFSLLLPRGAETDGRRYPLLNIFILLCGLLVVATPLGGVLQRGLEQIRFAVLHPGLQLLDTLETRYGHVAIAKLGKQSSIIEDGRITATFPDPHNIARQGAFYHAEANAPQNILMFGGIYDGLATELLKYPLDRLDVVVEDKAAFMAIKPWLPQSEQHLLQSQKIVLHFADGREFINRPAAVGNYDLVLVLVSDPASARHNRFFTWEFYEQLRNRMQPDGVLCTQISGASNYLGRDVQSYSGSVFNTLKRVFPHLLVIPGDNHTFCASQAAAVMTSDPGQLMERYKENPPVTGKLLPDSAFETLLEEERIKFLTARLQIDSGAINRDLTPVTFYLNVLLWSKFTAAGMGEFLQLLQRMGPWPYLVPPGVFLLLLLLSAIFGSGAKIARESWQQRGAMFALTMLGFVAMALQILLLFAFQTRVGLIFGRIAVLNGLFMTGLAIGAFLILGWQKKRHNPPGVLGTILALLGGFCFLLPTVLQKSSNLAGVELELFFYALALFVGLLAGGAFPLLVALIHASRQNSTATSGLSTAGDHLGGALGGLVTGGFLVPILGLQLGAKLLGVMVLLCLPPLLLFGRAPFGLEFFHTRNRASFGSKAPVAGLWFLLLSMAMLGWLARSSAPGPQVQFTEETLRDISGSHTFEYKSAPFPAYIGGGKKEEANKTTLSLASMPVAADISGYAGPLNLLVAVDGDGVLLGVRYVASHETPSYIQGLQPWLDGLLGSTPPQLPLSLKDIDALSGATVTSRAALATINKSSREGLRLILNRSWPQPAEIETAGEGLLTVRTVVVTTLLLLLLPVYLRAGSRGRTLYQLAALVALGFFCNLLLTEVDLTNLGLGRFSTWETNPAWWILAVPVLLLTPLFGQIYCGMLCPFGVLQEFVSRFGRKIGLGRQPQKGWDGYARFGKFILLTVVMSLVWLTGDGLWISFNPMQQFFSFNMDKTILAIAGLCFFAALFFFRFWCRYWCPLGAFFALGNKLALLDRFASKRRFNHCDLGVTHPFDVDCIRCDRCANEPTTKKLATPKHTPKLFATLMAIMAILIILHLQTAQQKQGQANGGWRKIDTQKLKTQIGSSRLSNKEAQWWREGEPNE